MSLSNTGSTQKASADTISLEYLRPYAWHGVTWFAVLELDWVRWATGMSAAGVDGVAGVKSREQV